MVGLFKNLDRKQVFSWALYDFANSAYAIIILSFVFPIFYREVIAGAKLGDFYWGLIGSISILLGGIASPIIGAIADEHKRKKSKFIFLVLISITGTGLLYFTGSGTLLLASIIFIIANLSFEIAQTLYDSFLSQISTKDTIGRISGFAWGLGYLGGAITLLLFKPLYGAGHEANEQLYRLTFPLTALFFLVFSLPAFFFLREQIEKSTISTGQLIKKGLGRVASTLKSFRNYKRIAWFMFGFYLFNDALVTLFAFMPLFAKVTIRMDITEIAILLLGAQVLAFPFTFLFGWLSWCLGN
jgi:UMF1 family MFS transporter